MIKKLVVISCLLVLGIFCTGCGPSHEQQTPQTASATTTTFAALLTAIPTPTPTRKPTETPMPIQTKKPAATATKTKTKQTTASLKEAPTIAATKEKTNPLKEFFIPIDKQNTIRGHIINDWTQKEKSSLDVNAPDTFFAICDPTGPNGFNQYLDKHPKELLIGVYVDPQDPTLCLYEYLTQLEAEKQIQAAYPELDPKSAEYTYLIGNYVKIGQFFKDIFPREKFIYDISRRLGIDFYRDASKKLKVALASWEANPTPGESGWIEDLDLDLE